MDKEPQKINLNMDNDKNVGVVQIADDVVAMIASLAAGEVEGVSYTSGNITNELMSKVKIKTLTKGTRVTVTGNEVKVDLALEMEYGFSIPAVSQMVQNKVKNTIENMTGLKVEVVNVHVVGVRI